MQAFDLVLGAFYNRPIELGDFKVGGLTDILAKALQVVVVAEYLEVVSLQHLQVKLSLSRT